MTGPRVGGLLPILEGRLWASDNGAFTGFDEELFLRHLRRVQEHQATCLFVAAPDVVADYRATRERFPHWQREIRGMGFKVAYVGQDGETEVPDCDCLFIGGSTDWKLSVYAERLCRQAKDRGLWIHMGRVNSERRILRAADMLCDSVDGTCTSFKGVARALTDIRGWLWSARGRLAQCRLPLTAPMGD